MDDLGPKVSYLVAKKGIPVYSSDEVQLGTVVEVLDAPEADIFDGVIFDTTPQPPRRPQIRRRARGRGDLRARRDPDDRRGGGGEAGDAGEEPGDSFRSRRTTWRASRRRASGRSAWDRLVGQGLSVWARGRPDGPPLSRTAGRFVRGSIRPPDRAHGRGRGARARGLLRAGVGDAAGAKSGGRCRAVAWRFRGRIRAGRGWRCGRGPRGSWRRMSTRRSTGGELIVTWVNRGTLHLIRAEDYPLLQALTTPQLWTSCRTRLRQTGVGEAAAERGVETVGRALADGGAADAGATARAARLGRRPDRGPGARPRPLLRLPPGRLRARADGRRRARLRRRPRLARRASRRSTVRRPSPSSRAATWSATARRSDADLARWAGLPLRDARAGLAAIARRLVDLGDGLVDLRKRETPRRSRRRACSAPSTRCCSAGPRARTSSAATRDWSRPTASSARSPWSTAAPSPPGASPRARSRSSTSSGSRKRRPAGSKPTRPPSKRSSRARRIRRRRVWGASGRRVCGGTSWPGAGCELLAPDAVQRDLQVGGHRDPDEEVEDQDDPAVDRLATGERLRRPGRAWCRASRRPAAG